MARSSASDTGRRNASMAASSRPGSAGATDRNASNAGASANGKRSATNAPNRAAAERRVGSAGRVPVILHEALPRLAVDVLRELRGGERPLHLPDGFFHDRSGVDARPDRFQDRLVTGAIEPVELALPGRERPVDRP